MPFKPSPNGITIFHQYLYMIISFLFQTFERVFIIWILSIHQLLSEVTGMCLFCFVIFCQTCLTWWFITTTVLSVKWFWHNKRCHSSFSGLYSLTLFNIIINKYLDFYRYTSGWVKLLFSQLSDSGITNVAIHHSKKKIQNVRRGVVCWDRTCGNVACGFSWIQPIASRANVERFKHAHPQASTTASSVAGGTTTSQCTRSPIHHHKKQQQQQQQRRPCATCSSWSLHRRSFRLQA